MTFNYTMSSMDESDRERLSNLLEENQRSGPDSHDSYEKERDEEYGNIRLEEYPFKYNIATEDYSLDVQKSHSYRLFGTLWTMAKNDESLWNARRTFYEIETRKRKNVKASELKGFTDENYFLPEDLREDFLEMIDSEDLVRKHHP